MSDLIQIGASGVRAFNTALAAIGENVSNASSTGYTRRTVNLSEASSGGDVLGYNAQATFNGVDIASIGRASDAYQATAARDATSEAAEASTRATWLASAESAMPDDAAGVGQSATAVFDAGTALAANPGSTSGRQAFLSALDGTASAFRTTAGQLATVSSGIADAATTSAQTLNAALTGLAKVNAALRGTQAGTEAQATLLDQRDQILGQVAGQVGVDVTFAGNGAATVQIAGGGPTLVSATAATVSHVSVTAGSTGRLSVSVVQPGGTTTLVASPGGTLGGLVSSANTVSDRRDALNQLAANFVAQVNGWNASGTTDAGAAGGALLTGTDAGTIALTTDAGGKTVGASAIAAASATSSNGNLLALSDLRGDGGVEAQWAAMVTDQGQVVSSANSASSAATARSTAAASALSSTTGVDLDTEAAELVRYQQAYSGAAKVIQVAKETMQSILDII